MKRARLPLLLALLAGLLFAGTLSHEYVLDDTRLVRGNPRLVPPAPIADLLTSDYWAPEASGLYRPLVTLSYAANARLGGGAAGDHAVNVLLHALNTLLVFAVARRAGAVVPLAAGTAALFAAHAVHTEAVANVAGRSELLCAFFFLTSLSIYPLRDRTPRRHRAMAASLVAYGLALLCKESAATFLLVLPLWVLCCGSAAARASAGSFARAVVPAWMAFAGITALYIALRIAVLPPGDALPPTSDLGNPLAALPAGLRILNALAVIQRYLGLLLLPINQSYDYSRGAFALLESFASREALWVGVAVAFEAVLLGVCLRRPGILAFAVGFAVATLSVVSNLVLPIGTIMGERLLYLPSLGFCLAVAYLMWQLAGRVASPQRQWLVFALTTGLLVAAHGARTLVRNAEWASEQRLYLADLEARPGSARIQHNAGFAYQQLAEHERALAHFDRALDIHPTYQLAYQNAGVSYAALGRLDRAIEIFEHALVLDPGSASLHEQLGNVLSEAGRFAEAAEHFAAATRIAAGGSTPRREPTR